VTSPSFPLSTAVIAERRRCARIVRALIPQPRYDIDDAVRAAVDKVVRQKLREAVELIRQGMPVPAHLQRRRTCTYCQGDVGPENHNRATCPKRFADLAFPTNHQGAA